MAVPRSYEMVVSVSRSPNGLYDTYLEDSSLPLPKVRRDELSPDGSEYQVCTYYAPPEDPRLGFPYSSKHPEISRVLAACRFLEEQGIVEIDWIHPTYANESENA